MAVVCQVLIEDEENINELRLKTPEFPETVRFTLKVPANSTPISSNLYREMWGLQKYMYIFIIDLRYLFERPLAYNILSSSMVIRIDISPI